MSRPQTSTRSVIWLLIPVAFAVRLFYSSMRQLVPDEAFYWVLSRHLAAGYLDHPPMVAYVIRLGTMLFGQTEVGVRCGAAVMAFGALVILLALCRRVIPGERATLILGIMWLCSPLFAGIATIMTPDTPAIFFSTAAMACAYFAVAHGGVGSALADGMRGRVRDSRTQTIPSAKADPTKYWLFFGLFTGLAMMSKYTAVLPAAAVVMALLTSEDGRREFRKSGVWLALVVALLVFWPVIHWNATHNWASFKFQLHHGLDDAESAEQTDSQRMTQRFVSLGKYLAGQIGFYTPVFFIFGVVVVAIRWRHYRELSAGFRILLWSATVPLLFFAFSAFKSGAPGEGNWPAFGYLPMSLLTLEHVARRWKRGDIQTLIVGSGVALVITAALHSPDLVYKITAHTGGRLHYPRKLNDFYGWREMARSVEGARMGAPVVAGRHQDAAELSFYLPGQPEVWVYPLTNLAGKADNRPTAYDYFPDRPDISKEQRVLFVHGHADDFCRIYGFATTTLDAMIGGVTIPLHGLLRERRFYQCVHK